MGSVMGEGRRSSLYRSMSAAWLVFGGPAPGEGQPGQALAGSPPTFGSCPGGTLPAAEGRGGPARGPCWPLTLLERFSFPCKVYISSVTQLKLKTSRFSQQRNYVVNPL